MNSKGADSSNSNSNSRNTSCQNAIDFLNQECGVCSKCATFLIIAERDEKRRDGGNGNGECTVCFGLSSSSFPKDFILPKIEEALLPYCRERAQPQLGADNSATTTGADVDASGAFKRRRPLIHADRGNFITRESPTVNLPWLIAVRAQCAIAAANWHMAKTSNEAEPSAGPSPLQLRSAEEVYSCIKEHLRSSLRDSILETLSSSDIERNPSKADRIVLSEQMHEEESGYLGIHILCLPPLLSSMACDENKKRNASLIPPSLQAQIRQQKQQIQQRHHRAINPRKRFRGNDPTSKQGGDPRTNLELRLRRSQLVCQDAKYGALSEDGGTKNKLVEKEHKTNNKIHEWDTIISWLEKSTALQWIEKENSGVGTKDGDENSDCSTTWLQQLHQSVSRHQSKAELESSQQCSIHVAAWRRPFYIQGTYTKSRRDISQTPFYVPAVSKKTASDNKEGAAKTHNKSHNAMVRKGVSSVEEEICPPLAVFGCGGVSDRNNEQVSKITACSNNDSAQQSGCEKGAIVYGMCKFHASGREDMDVRMLLPPPSVAKASAKSNVLITGRPFVCEIYDAHKIPSDIDLEKVVNAINCHEVKATIINDDSSKESKEIEMDEGKWPRTLVPPDRYHGNNPKGVGVSAPLALVPSVAFSGLQSETEEKVKFYGCVCWTSVSIASDEELIEKLGCLAWDKEGDDVDNTNDGTKQRGIYPLKIQQSTPLRVLHRRSSEIRTRYVLGLSACRIDDHWFRLRMSTSAGTYVKEFVHGDCGRTHPNIGSMLGGRTDITELDCESIAM